MKSEPEAVLRDSVRLHALAEVVSGADPLAVHGQRTARGVVPLPDPGRPVVQVAGVAGRGEDHTAGGDRRVDSPCHDAVLKGRLTEVEDIVDDDVRPGLAERFDVGREPRLSAERRGEIQLGAGRKIVDDLEHRRPFPPESRLLRQHRHPVRQVARNLHVRVRIGPIRKHTDPDAGSVDAVGQTRQVRLVGDVALGGAGPHGGLRIRPDVEPVLRRPVPPEQHGLVVRARRFRQRPHPARQGSRHPVSQCRRRGAVLLRQVDPASPHGFQHLLPDIGWETLRLAARGRLLGGADPLDRIQLGEPLHGSQGEVRPDGAVPRYSVADGSAQFPDTRQDLGRDVGPDVHRHRLFPGVRAQGLPTVGSGRRWLPLPCPPRVQKLRTHLPLGTRPPGLGRQQGLDLPHRLRRQAAARRFPPLPGPVRHRLIRERQRLVAGRVLDRLCLPLLGHGIAHGYRLALNE